jgi:hypothetical protein
MAKQNETYNNLIDFCIEQEKNPEAAGDNTVIFRFILTDYFFKFECGESRKVEALLNEITIPPVIKSSPSIFEIDLEKLREQIEGEMVNESLCGKIMLSPAYLKSFFPNHPPSYAKLPNDIKFELMDIIKEKNLLIFEAFEKMERDIEAVRKRTTLSLIALTLKNIHKKNGRPFAALQRSADEIISDIFIKTGDIFKGTKIQVSDARDDSKIKELIKQFFQVRQFKEITQLSDLYKHEIDRFIKRAQKVFS